MAAIAPATPDMPWGKPPEVGDVCSDSAADAAPLFRGRTHVTDALLKGLGAPTAAASGAAATTTTAAPVGVDAQSQATLLLRKRKEARLAGEELAAAVAAHAAATVTLDAREAALAARAQAQQATAARFRPFLDESAAKCERSARRERADVAAAASLDGDIAAARADIARAQADWAAVEADAGRLRRYADYLADVKAKADGVVGGEGAHGVGAGGVAVGAGSAGGGGASWPSGERFDDVREILSRWVATGRATRVYLAAAWCVTFALTSPLPRARVRCAAGTQRWWQPTLTCARRRRRWTANWRSCGRRPRRLRWGHARL